MCRVSRDLTAAYNYHNNIISLSNAAFFGVLFFSELGVVMEEIWDFVYNNYYELISVEYFRNCFHIS